MELEWTDEPDQKIGQTQFILKRTGTTKIVGICTCDKPTGLYTHFFRGRTRPHFSRGKCEACESNNAPRWHGYISLFNPKTIDHWVHELTTGAYQGVKHGLDAYQTLRGHTITLQRRAKTTTAPIITMVYPEKIANVQLPPPPDLQAILYRLWDCEKWTEPETDIADRLQDHLKPGGNGAKSRT